MLRRIFRARFRLMVLGVFSPVLRSELTATVDCGENAINFALDSNSPVVQPDRIRPAAE
jgi:hypothetical protein